MPRNRAERTAYDVILDAPDLGGSTRIGTIYRHAVRTDLAASFEYEPAWLHGDNVFSLDPRLELWAGEHHPVQGAKAFGIFLDSAPDRWGRVLMERREAAASLREQRAPRALQELDFLLGVHDQTRIGALRFREVNGVAFLDASATAVPPVTSIRELAHVSQRIEQPGVEELPEYEQWLAMLIAPGTSLGGARPKASFTDDDALWIAKFPSREDRYDVGGWEFLTHRLAGRAGIVVPDARLESLTERYQTFCVCRFDRVGHARRMYASAMTLLDRHDSEAASYVDLAQLIADQGAIHHIDDDLEQLFRRVVFNVLIGNRDDHLRNHGFLRERTGWRLSPAFDMNPNPNRQDHVLTLDGERATPNLDVVRASADYYRLDARSADRIIHEIQDVLTGWESAARSLNLPRAEIARMRTVIQ